MQAVTFSRAWFHCGCCVTELVCADGVHLQRNYQDDGRNETWNIIGNCDGSCRYELKRKVAAIVGEFKRTHERRQLLTFHSLPVVCTDPDYWDFYPNLKDPNCVVDIYEDEEGVRFVERPLDENLRPDFLELEQERLECRPRRRWRR